LNKITFLKKLDAIAGPLLARLLPASLPHNQPPLVVQRVLFIRPGGIGDAALLIPTIKALTVSYPQVIIEVLAEKRNGAVFDMCPQIAKVFYYDNWRDWHKFLVRRYDIIVDTEQWHYLSAIIARLLRAPVRCGFATNERQNLFTHTANYSHDSYEVDSFYSLLAAVGLDVSQSAGGVFLDISTVVEDRSRALLPYVDATPYVVLFPGASIKERRWSGSAFHTVAERCNGLGYGVVVVGGGKDIQIGEQIVATLQGVNLAGKTTLAETAVILKGAKLLISGDSGVLHLAAGVDCPTVALFGPGIINKWAPRGENHKVVSLDLPCAPCTKFGTTPECTEGGRCIKEISVDMVWDVVKTLPMK